MTKVLWIYGRPSAGKTTIAEGLVDIIWDRTTYVTFDGDDLRKGINSDLSFSKDDRHMAAIRAAHMCKHIADNDLLDYIIIAMITPLRATRRVVKDILGDLVNFIYIYCPLQECERRDIKGLYGNGAKDIRYFEESETDEHRNLVLDTSTLTKYLCLDKTLTFLESERLDTYEKRQIRIVQRGDTR